MKPFLYLAKSILKLTVVLSLVWLCGIFIFITQIPDDYSIPMEDTDAVVVLTGGALRLEEGLAIFSVFNNKKLLISGTGNGVTAKALLDIANSQHLLDKVGAEVVLGNLATSTITNAYETKVFMDLNGFSSLRLVTSNYHMPRSKLIFEYVMPEKKIIYHSVYSINFRKAGNYISFRSFMMVAGEYNKYLMTLVIIADETLLGYWDKGVAYIASWFREK
jgi:uncharacterized SAM-binding protein YcdF (DUF218 family)